MVVVSNTSPLSNLAIIGCLGLLRDQFGSILVPPAVRQELSRLQHASAKRSLDEAFCDGWVEAIPLMKPVPEHLLAGLHLGEAEALALALEQGADLTLLDDGDARIRAAEAGLQITGVLGILLKAKTQGRIPSLQQSIQRLRHEARFFVATRLEKELIEAAGEAPD